MSLTQELLDLLCAAPWSRIGWFLLKWLAAGAIVAPFVGGLLAEAARQDTTSPDLDDTWRAAPDPPEWRNAVKRYQQRADAEHESWLEMERRTR